MAVHVVPIEDGLEHVLDGDDCPCDLDVVYIDPDTELPYPGGHMVTHHSAILPDAEHLGWDVLLVN